MDLDIEYILYYLEDEFRDLSDYRMHPVAPTGTQKSVDLPQDYDPNENDVHLARGVRVRAKSRDYFFPAYWVTSGQLEQMRELAKEIRVFLLVG